MDISDFGLQHMQIVHWQIVAGVACLLCIVLYGKYRYWKAAATSCGDECDCCDDCGSGSWMSEAKFWRRHFDKDAAEWVEDTF